MARSIKLYMDTLDKLNSIAEIYIAPSYFTIDENVSGQGKYTVIIYHTDRDRTDASMRFYEDVKSEFGSVNIRTQHNPSNVTFVIEIEE